MQEPLRFPEVSGDILIAFLDGATGGQSATWPMENEKTYAWEIIILEQLPFHYN